MSLIIAENLVKTFKVSQKKTGIRGAVKGLFFPNYRVVRAVDDISFKVARGETIGFLGPNGAGKSTTIKMLSGILHPTSGRVEINGLSPQRDRRAVVRDMGVVFGQRTQLYWDLRLGESFELLKRVYRIEDSVFRRNITWMREEFGLGKLMDTPVRQLSLGQRMRGEISASLLHSPSVLFLDEPTIGLDIEAKQALRELIHKVNREREISVILTTHDLEDVERLCERLVVIDQGKIVEDGPIDQLMRQLLPYRILEVEIEQEFAGDPVVCLMHGEVVESDGRMLRIRFDRNHASASMVIQEVLKQVDVKDLKVREPAVEEMVMMIYRGQHRDSRLELVNV